ncbi:putative lipase atg15 [Didymosphaeria variabile]|uniref:triacylglycerol lipase n=1 Tax=Didymosphaeria variabile TaxID=1932322 RepID=A0A9W8XHR0_9PLEO|nr:putative lipase atg15 [Didymosphaeria variabile]KAJ4349889.1 putative lipase atg15 [Didymosphaeria variabile]
MSSLLLSFLAATSAAVPPILPPPISPQRPTEAVKEFSLKHIFHHGTHKYPELHRRLDVPENTAVWMVEDDRTEREAVPPFTIRSEAVTIQRLKDRSKETINGILDWGRMTGKPVTMVADDWTVDEIAGPNVTDKDSVLTFARMAANAYILEPNTGGWEDVKGGFNYTEDFGWQADGLRGHIFADTKNETVVIGLKGTSPALFDGTETTTNDKINDNLFFSCCCGQGGQYLWRQVCDCQASVYSCNSTCLVGALREKNRYYYAARDLYHNVTALYPNAEVWMAGHSLGGAVSSFISLTYGHPAITFEAVPDAMPASRLGLPVPPGHEIGSMQKRGMTAVHHFGHTADPIFMGSCNQAGSMCTLGGYAMESVCHTGKKCVYDTVEDLGWRVGIGTHKIVNVIKQVLEKYDEPAKCEQYIDCTDCFNWEYFESNGTGTTTSFTVPTTTSTSTSTSTRKRTETCKTPGWFGCLDESTTTEATTTKRHKETSSTSTSTCKTPGWFGCLDDDETSTTTKVKPSAAPVPSATTTSSYPTPTSARSCMHRGWFGDCLDPTDIASTSKKPKHTHTPTSASLTTCTHKGFFGLICFNEHEGSRTGEISPVTERMEM